MMILIRVFAVGAICCRLSLASCKLCSRVIQLLEEHLVVSFLKLQPHLELSVFLDDLLHIQVQLLHLAVLKIQLFSRLLQLFDDIVDKNTGISIIQPSMLRVAICVHAR